MGPLDAPEEVEGISYESLFFQELKAVNDYYDDFLTLTAQTTYNLYNHQARRRAN
jgi:hypothetical protein